MGRAETHGNFAACRAMRERVSAWHDGVGEHDDVLTDHLSACADCRSFAAALPPLTQRLTAWADAPDARLAALAARLESHTGGGSLRRLGAPARGAVALRLAASLLGAALVGLPAWWQRDRAAAAGEATRSPLLRTLDGRALATGDDRLAAWQPLLASALAQADSATPPKAEPDVGVDR